eukprot:3094923-Pleurochrysis_carterae.AAC.1
MRSIHCSAPLPSARTPFWRQAEKNAIPAIVDGRATYLTPQRPPVLRVRILPVQGRKERKGGRARKAARREK